MNVKALGLRRLRQRRLTETAARLQRRMDVIATQQKAMREIIERVSDRGAIAVARSEYKAAVRRRMFLVTQLHKVQLELATV